MQKILWGDLQKVDENNDGTITVFGIASGEERDSSGEIVTANAMRKAIPGYMSYPALREMHQLAAAGRTLELSVDNDGVTHIAALVTDPVAVLKVKTKTYSGFSIGGKITSRDKADPTIITGLNLSEISLVDRPCLPSACLTLFKADAPNEGDTMDEHQEAAVMSPDATPPAGSEEEMAKSCGFGSVGEAALGVAAKVAEGKEAAPEAVEVVAEAPAPEGAEAEKAATVDPEPAAEAPAEEVAKTDEAEVTHADSGTETVTLQKTEDGAEEITLQKTAAEKAADAVAALEALAKTNDPEDVQKGMYSVSQFAEVLNSIAFILSDADYEAEFEKDTSVVPSALRGWLKDGVAIFKEMAIEEVNELVAYYTSKAAPKGDLSKTDDAAGAETDTAKATGADEALAKAQADNEALKADLAKRDEAFEAIADRITKANEEITKKLATKLEETSKALEDTQDRLKKVEDTPLPPKTTVLPVGITAISKAEDSAGLGSTTTQAPALTQEQANAALAAMTPDERAMVLTKAALQRPIFLGR